MVGCPLSGSPGLICGLILRCHHEKDKLYATLH
jgi:hypothetical protein